MEPIDIQNPKKLRDIKDFSGEFKVMGIENLSEFEVFSKLFPESIYQVVVQETNRYAKVMIDKLKPLKTNSRFHDWTDVTVGPGPPGRVIVLSGPSPYSSGRNIMTAKQRRTHPRSTPIVDGSSPREQQDQN